MITVSSNIICDGYSRSVQMDVPPLFVTPTHANIMEDGHCQSSVRAATLKHTVCVCVKRSVLAKC